MKRLIVGFLALALFVGFSSADPGIVSPPENQGLSTLTVVSAVGGFTQETDLDWRMTNGHGGLNGIPSLGDSGQEGSIDVIQWDPLQLVAQGQNTGAVYYAAVYTEDTGSNGLGRIDYTKNLGIDTGAKVTGQSNIEAIKQLVYTGDPGSKVLSNDFISIDGAGNPSSSARFGLAVNTDPPEPYPFNFGESICPFGGGNFSPAFCSHVESGSAIDMNIADVATTTNGRFVTKSTDAGLELNHDIRVSDSVGKVSAVINAEIREARSTEDFWDFNLTMWDPNTGHEYDFVGWIGIGSTDPATETTLHDFTSVDGAVVKFDKSMSYTSGILL
jgi:hypothetical protein